MMQSIMSTIVKVDRDSCRVLCKLACTFRDSSASSCDSNSLQLRDIIERERERERENTCTEDYIGRENILLLYVIYIETFRDSSASCCDSNSIQLHTQV